MNPTNRLVAGMLLGSALFASGCAAPLYNAARDGDVQTVRTLLDQGEKPDGVGGLSEGNALHWAALNGHVQVMELLLSRGADLQANVGYGTPLHWASKGGQFKAVQLLLDRGSDANAKNGNGWTPLHYAAQQGYIQIARLLLDRGAVAGEPASGGKAKKRVAVGVEPRRLLPETTAMMRWPGCWSKPKGEGNSRRCPRGSGKPTRRVASSKGSSTS